ncbi:hypothetical protein [Streptomyces sp. NPDC058240]|uniref:hypothetical protein n=1 Tax=Streptomyces sp. NPDC058240 TaxID=3346396 RepID=UPI0036E001E1
MGTAVPVMEKFLADSLQTIGTSHRASSGTLTTSLDVARIRCVVDPDAVMLEIWESWLLTMQVHSAVFAADPGVGAEMLRNWIRTTDGLRPGARSACPSDRRGPARPAHTRSPY